MVDIKKFLTKILKTLIYYNQKSKKFIIEARWGQSVKLLKIGIVKAFDGVFSKLVLNFC